jgi:hypothetical protein
MNINNIFSSEIINLEKKIFITYYTHMHVDELYIYFGSNRKIYCTDNKVK